MCGLTVTLDVFKSLKYNELSKSIEWLTVTLDVFKSKTVVCESELGYD